MKKLIKKIVIIAIAVIAGFNVYSNQKQDVFANLALANLDALANNTEYSIGPIGTNWKTYRIECTRTVGLDYILVSTSTYTYWTDACGSGGGFCLDAAGC